MNRTGSVSLKDVLAAFQRGAKVFLVEYRKSTAENITWRDKQSGRTLTGAVLRHTVETETESLIVDERPPDEFKVELFKPPFAKGQRCALWLTEMTSERGVNRARGQLQAVSEGSAP